MTADLTRTPELPKELEAAHAEFERTAGRFAPTPDAAHAAWVREAGKIRDRSWDNLEADLPALHDKITEVADVLPKVEAELRQAPDAVRCFARAHHVSVESLSPEAKATIWLGWGW